MDREQEQRERAYQIWEDEGRPDGQHEEHWKKAEQDQALHTSKSDEITQANIEGEERFSGGQRDTAGAPLLKISPD